jgi:hypothetical protein
MASLAPAATALAINVTLDDFDAVFTYSDDKSFTTNGMYWLNPPLLDSRELTLSR